MTLRRHTAFPALGCLLACAPLAAQSDPTQQAAWDSVGKTVVPAQASHRITATAVHSRMIGETPKIYYIHFWADGTPAAVLAGLRAAIDAGR